MQTRYNKACCGDSWWGAAARAACAAVLLTIGCGCTHMNPYEYADQAKQAPNDVRRLLPPLSASQSELKEPVYQGNLRRRMGDADDLRLAMQLTLQQLQNERAVYDGAFWVVAPYLVYNPAPGNLLKAAAAFGGGYAFLNSRPKDMARLYQKGVAELDCLIEEYRPYLYSVGDYATLSDLSDTLHTAVGNYQRDAADVSAGISDIVLPGSAVICASARSAECAERRRALGAGSGGAPSGAAVESYDQQQLALAAELMDKLEELVAVIGERAEQDFFGRTQAIMVNAGIKLRENQAPLESRVFTASAQGGAGMKAHSGKRGGVNGAAKPPLPKGLKATTAASYRASQRALEQAMFSAAHMLRQHERRNVGARQTMQERGCMALKAAGARPAVNSNTPDADSTETALPGGG